MTCREQLKIDYPNQVSECYIGGCWGCPHDYYDIPTPKKTEDGCCTIGCTERWNREFPETESTKPTVEPTEPKEDVVNHPNHYTNGGMECIDEMILIFGKEATMHFCLLNAWKYRRRAIFKNGEEDIKKSHWYINKYKELMEECQKTSQKSSQNGM